MMLIMDIKQIVSHVSRRVINVYATRPRRALPVFYHIQKKHVLVCGGTEKLTKKMVFCHEHDEAVLHTVFRPMSGLVGIIKIHDV